MAEDNFVFYNKGKEMWKSSYDFQDDFEDKFRVQLEQSDRLQGFQMTADVTSGYGSLANIVANDMMRDQAPKAPILLYALENSNKVDRDVHKSKFEILELNKALWLGELSANVDMVVPFDSQFMEN